MSSTATHTATGLASPSASVSGALSTPSSLKIVGILLAIISGVLIGTSFVFKKKGLLKSQADGAAGEGVAYLKSFLWWSGMTLMIIGELCNFAAYAFVEAIVVTPFGALSVVISAILASIFLKEKLTFFGWLGCALCILGSVIIALNGPAEPAVGQIAEFQKLFLAPGFLAYGGTLIAASFVIVLFVIPKYGKKQMIWLILVCSMIGGISVSVTTGLGAAVVTTAQGHNQFNHWFIYFLMGFVISTLVTEIFYLNVALALFNTAMVTPTYYVIFTFCSMLSTIVLFKGLKAPATQIITLVMGFLVICLGIIILQLSRVDPAEFAAIDDKSTMLLQAARVRTENSVSEGDEKSIFGAEDPGIDSLRGSFGTIGSIIRARSARKMSLSARGSQRGSLHDGGELRLRSSKARNTINIDGVPDRDPGIFDGLKRHQLYDAPVPRTTSILYSDSSPQRSREPSSSMSPRQQTIKFDNQDIVHSYGPGGTVTHEHRYTPYQNPPSLSLLSQVSPAEEDEFAESASTRRLSTIIGASVEEFSQSNEDGIAMSSSSTHLIDDDEDVRMKMKERAPRTSSSSGKRYPSGDPDLDRDESLSLWDKDSDDAMEYYPPVGSGIRLVSKSRT